MVPVCGVEIRVMLVGHQLTVWGLERLIESEHPRIRVVSTATDCGRGIEIAERTQPDVVVVEIDAIQERGADVLATFIGGRATRIVVLTGARDARDGEASILRGATGVVQKSESPGTLVRAIEKVHQGQLWLDRATTGRLFVELSRARNGGSLPDPEEEKIRSLTTREREIVTRLADDPGADNKSLAGRLHIGEHTLRNHLSRIYDKLGVLNRVQLYMYARRRGLTPAL
jgi:DNA-binding NarL/FixJ family response regulator